MSAPLKPRSGHVPTAIRSRPSGGRRCRHHSACRVGAAFLPGACCDDRPPPLQAGIAQRQKLGQDTGWPQIATGGLPVDMLPSLRRETHVTATLQMEGPR